MTQDSSAAAISNSATQQQTTSSQIDRIVYLASLASRPRDIDPIIEPMRLITSKLHGNEQPSPEDAQKLTAVQQQLELYLIQREPLRRFTADSLRQKLQEGTAGHATQPLTGSVITWIVVTFILAALPYVAGPSVDSELKQASSSVSILTGLCLATGWFFTTSVRDFKQELQAAFRLIAIGVIIFGIAMFTQPVRSILGAPDVTWTHFELSIMPFFVAHVPIYFGARTLALQLQIRSRLTRPLLIAGLLAVAALVVTFLPHVSTPAREPFFDLSAIFLIWCGLLTATSIRLLYVVSRAIGLYGKPTRRFAAGYAALSISSWMYLIIRFTAGYIEPGPLQIVSYIPTLVGGALLFIAAIRFKRVSAS